MTNAERIAAASRALETVDDEIVGDLLANLMHWCDSRRISFDGELRNAREHYAAEKGEGA
jgi:hypothetical protein